MSPPLQLACFQHLTVANAWKGMPTGKGFILALKLSLGLNKWKCLAKALLQKKSLLLLGLKTEPLSSQSLPLEWGRGSELKVGGATQMGLHMKQCKTKVTPSMETLTVSVDLRTSLKTSWIKVWHYTMRHSKGFIATRGRKISKEISPESSSQARRRGAHLLAGFFHTPVNSTCRENKLVSLVVKGMIL